MNFEVGELVVVMIGNPALCGLAEVLTCDNSVIYGHHVQILNGGPFHGQNVPCAVFELKKLSQQNEL